MLVQTCEMSPKQIGIVTPYRLQCKKIKQVCYERNWCDVLVGSAEQFQGSERDCTIVSTVRSGVQAMGNFVGNDKVSSWNNLFFCDMPKCNQLTFTEDQRYDH